MNKGKKTFTAHPQTHTYSLKLKNMHRSLQVQSSCGMYSEKPVNTHAQRKAPNNWMGPHMDKPWGYSEQDESTKLPQSPRTKPQTPTLHMVPSLLKEHNSQHPKGRDHQQQRTLLTRTTCSDIYFGKKGQQSESDKPTPLSFFMQQRPGSPDHASHALTIRKEYVLWSPPP